MSNDLKRQIPCRIPDPKPSVAVDWEGVRIPMYFQEELLYMGVSKNNGTPKSSILMGFSIINHPFLGYHYFWKHSYDMNLEQPILFWVPTDSFSLSLERGFSMSGNLI